ncbi:kinase-like domain-containing protein [Trichoderma longibrachiatum]
MDLAREESYTACPPQPGSPHLATEDQHEQPLQQALNLALELQKTLNAAHIRGKAAEKAQQMVSCLQKALDKTLVPEGTDSHAAGTAEAPQSVESREGDVPADRASSDIPDTEHWSPKPWSPQPTVAESFKPHQRSDRASSDIPDTEHWSPKPWSPQPTVAESFKPHQHSDIPNITPSQAANARSLWFPKSQPADFKPSETLLPWSPQPQPAFPLPSTDDIPELGGLHFQANARLVITYPPGNRLLLEKYPDILLQSDQCLTAPYLNDVYAVVQSEANASVRLPLLPKDQTLGTGVSELQVIFHPTSDGCFFQQKGRVSPNIHFTTFDGKNEHCLQHSKTVFIPSGEWIVSTDWGYSKTMVIAIRKRQFTFNIQHRWPSKGLGKRQPTGELEGDQRARRQKRADGYTTKPQDTASQQTATVVTDLNVGDAVDIRTKVAAGLPYRLQIIKYIHRGQRSSVYTCSLSGFSNEVAAKTFIGDDDTSIPKAANSWTVEATLLTRFKHENIVKVMAVDARIFTIYEEVLPPSLAKQRMPLSYRDSLIIAQHMSSALKYLQAQGVIHHDIKPENIAWSHERGAVLLDFELSSPHDNGSGGTSYFLPPEFLSGRSGFAGDIWALGITMLCATGKLKLPKGFGWFIFNAQDPGSEDSRIMKRWLQSVNGIRSQLADMLPTQPNHAELFLLIYKMLNPDPGERVNAADLHTATQKLTVSEIVHRKIFLR